MGATPELIVQHDADALAHHVADRTVTALVAAQQRYGRAAVALTAGSIMESIWSALAASETARQVDWSRVDIFWGDERFVPSEAADRNDTAFVQTVLSHEPFSSAHHYPMPTSDGARGEDLDGAAADYAVTLRDARREADPDDQPAFDVVLLGIGPDGHCCSLFPRHPGLDDGSSTVIPIRDSPKPPPNRISLSFGGLTTAREIWVVASGDGKAEAVARALGGADRHDVPSAGAQGTERTLWFVDEAAASQLSR